LRSRIAAYTHNDTAGGSRNYENKGKTMNVSARRHFSQMHTTKSMFLYGKGALLKKILGQ